MTRVTDIRDQLFDDLSMNASSEFVLAVGVVAALGAAGLRFGPSNAIEGLRLTLLLMGLKIARSALRALSAALKTLRR